ncbi:uncharacterized protein [Epargyreus clarus]|uniref:uncharacterized protein n=1 Tax=Epargyreus clarus TaxID=520877 RepID=UPI003C2C505C
MLIRITPLILLQLFWNLSECSLVIDAYSQKGIHIENYCPKIEYCIEGSHVMCMYYDPNRVMGHHCSNPMDITMTPDLATKLLDVTNAVRSKIALGKETGKNGSLPRGYGIFRLSWDEELATFAQVLANQCVLRHDLCRATKRFPDPGQGAGLVRFTYPDWFPVSKHAHFTTPGLTASKLNYAITQTLKTWYGQKNFVTQEMIENYPDWLQNPGDQRGKLYLEMISGPATHMGCGVSAYTQFAYHDNNAPLNYNSIQVVCNFSARSRKGTQVYTTTPPTQIGYTIRCGCPEGYDEDADCLCFESPRQPVSPRPNYCPDGNCKPAVVLLPIFTVEDAPPDKLIPHGINNNTLRIGQSLEILNSNGDYKMNARIQEPQSLNEFSKLLREPDITRSTYDLKGTIQNRISKNSKRIENVRHYTQPTLYSPNREPFAQKYEAKGSIFSKVTKFKLPRKIFNSRRITAKEIKKDVIPRRDFSNVQNALRTYLNKKRSRIENVLKSSYEYTSKQPPKAEEKFEHVKVVSKNKVISPYRYSKQISRDADLNITKELKDIGVNSNEEADKKLMKLLDNLEKEVKHIELDPADKEIFDAKIRKIYGTVLGKSENLEHKTMHLMTENKIRNKELNDNLINYENAADSEFIDKKRLQETEVYNKKPAERGQKSMIQDNNYRNVLHSIYNNEFLDEDYVNDGLTYRNGNRVSKVTNDRNSYKFSDTEGHRNKNFELNGMTEDHLSYERRKYYQDKLDNLARKFQSVRNNQRRNINPPRQVRPVLSTSHNKMQIRPSKGKETDTFYIPDRARFIHGF